MPEPGDHPHLKTLPPVLGLFDASAIVIGSVIGSGVFLKAKTIAAALPGDSGLPGYWPILSVWVLVGLVTLCGSLTLAELAAMLPQAGGPYVYLREAFGRAPAFLWGWTEFWIIRTGSIGALATASVLALNKFLEDSGQEALPHMVQGALAALIVILLAAANMIGTRWGARVQNLTTVLKAGTLVAIIVLPWLLGKADLRLLQVAGTPPKDYSFWRGYAAAVVAVMWAYDGWVNVSPVAEEVRHPERNLPLALLFGTLALILLYVGANTSYHLLLPLPEIAKAEVPAAEAMKVLFARGGQVTALALVVSTFGAVNSNMLTGPRIYFAMARDHLLPRAIHRIHGQWQTPANAIFFQAAWTVVLIAGAFAWTSRGGNTGFKDPHEAFDKLTNYALFGGALFYALAVSSVFVLRAKRPDLPRPYKTWGYPLTPILYLVAFAGALASLLVESWQESLVGSIIIVAGVFYYLVARRHVPHHHVERPA